MKSFEELKKKDLAWSLKPILILMKMCGMPAHDASNNRCRFFVYIFSMLSITSLLFNCSFNIFYFIKNWLYYYKCKWQKSDPKQMGFVVIYMNSPEQIVDFFEILTKTSFVVGVPLIFVFKCYVTDGWRNIWNCISRIDEEMDWLTRSFYRRCRKISVFFVIFSILVSKIVYM